MKIVLILLIAVAAIVFGAPVEESNKEKRGLTLGLGYHHTPFVTHSHYVAPAVVHHAPLISHAPIIAHAPIYTAHHPIAYHSYPSYHSIHHFK